MAQSISGFAEAARVGLDIACAQYNKNPDFIYKQIGFKPQVTTQQYLKAYDERDMEYLTQVGENTAHPESIIELANTRSLYWYTYKGKVVLSEEKIDTDQTGYYKPGAVNSRLLNAAKMTEEAIHVQRFNLSFGTSYLMNDGKPLCDAPTLGQGGHTLASGIQHNRGYYDGSTYAEVSFSETGVENIITNMSQYVSHKGNMAPLMGPYKLLVGPRNFMAARKFNETMKSIGNNYNNKNVARDFIADVIMHPLITTASWWLIDTSNEIPLITLVKDNIRSWTKADDDVSNVALGVNFRKAAHATGWRGIHGSYTA